MDGAGLGLGEAGAASRNCAPSAAAMLQPGRARYARLPDDEDDGDGHSDKTRACGEWVLAP